MDGVGGSDAKVEQTATEEDEADDVDDEEEQLSQEEETDGSRATYNKNIWRVIAVWTNVTKKEAYRQALEIMTDDFNVGSGPTHPWGELNDKKIGPFSSRSVSICFYLFVQAF